MDLNGGSPECEAYEDGYGDGDGFGSGGTGWGDGLHHGRIDGSGIGRGHEPLHFLSGNDLRSKIIQIKLAL